MLRQSGQGVDHGVGGREVDGHIDVAHPSSRDTGAGMVVVDVEPSRHLEAVRLTELVDQPAHPTVSDHEETHDRALTASGCSGPRRPG